MGEASAGPLSPPRPTPYLPAWGQAGVGLRFPRSQQPSLLSPTPRPSLHSCLQRPAQAGRFHCAEVCPALTTSHTWVPQATNSLLDFRRVAALSGLISSMAGGSHSPKAALGDPTQGSQAGREVGAPPRCRAPALSGSERERWPEDLPGPVLLPGLGPFPLSIQIQLLQGVLPDCTSSSCLPFNKHQLSLPHPWAQALCCRSSGRYQD